jgi:hypothetical protein
VRLREGPRAVELDGSPGQLWRYDATRRTIIHQASGRALDVSQTAHHHGVGMLILHPCKGGPNQQWVYDAATRALASKGGALGFTGPEDTEGQAGLCVGGAECVGASLQSPCSRRQVTI